MNVKLFLGYPLTEPLKNELDKSRLVDMFVNDEGLYLQRIMHEELFFLGKELGPSTDLAKLQLLQTNIYSLLAKILPEYPFKDTPLLLFTKIDL